MRLLLVPVCVLLGTSGCPTPALERVPDEVTIVAPVEVVEKLPPPKIALVLGGGGARGFAHVGVLRVLEQEKIPIDLIVGTSVGSLIGALYASNPNTFELEWSAFQMEASDLLDFSLFSITKGPVAGDAILEFVEEQVKTKRIEDLKIQTVIIATDLNTGERVDLTTGLVSEAVRASVSVPGVFVPHQLGGRTLVDGGLVANLGVDVAREYGADIVIAVNITENVVDYDLNNIVSIIAQSVNIMMGQMAEAQLKNADIVIRPDVFDVSTFDFDQKKRCMMEGIEATKKIVPQLRRLLEAYAPRPAS